MTPLCGHTQKRALGRSPHLDVHRADTLDVSGDDIARLDRADAFGRAGDDDVAGIQRVERRGVLDQRRDAEDQVSGVRVLPLFAVDRDAQIELAVVIGKETKNVSRGDALDHVAGYAIGLDITIRGPEERSLRKSPDSYAVLGPWLVTPDEIANPGGLDLRIAVNGEQRQSSNTRYLILGVAELIEYASSFYTLYPGDIIMTGTPEGVSPIQPGDVISAYIERIGTMEVKVRAA